MSSAFSPSSTSSLASSTTSDSSVLVVTITVAALTTTFTPPPECTQNHLSQMSSPGYMIWLNEPQPVPGVKNGDCYPSQFIQGYTSIGNSSSSIAPMFSPLICPLGWHTAATYASGYIACCASGYQLAPPSTTVDPSRPAYGGTCYSDFSLGQTAAVTQYGTANITATSEFVASTTPAQAYAHPMDGFQATDVVTTSLSGGVIAGIVIGTVAGLFAVMVGIFFLFRHRRKHAAAGRGAGHDNNDGQMTEHGGAGAHTDHGSVADKDLAKQLPNLPNSNMTWTSSPTETSMSPSVASPGQHGHVYRHELDAGHQAHELDTGYQGAEMRGS